MSNALLSLSAIIRASLDTLTPLPANDTSDCIAVWSGVCGVTGLPGTSGVAICAGRWPGASVGVVPPCLLP